MSIQTLNGDGYTIEYNPGTQSIRFEGTIRLQSAEEYAPVKALLQEAHRATPAGEVLRLDLRQLRFLNSSGINTISRFVITARKEDRVQLVVLGNQDIYWQKKSLVNLQRLWPKVEIDIR